MELLVVTSIFMVLSSVVLTTNARFGNTIVLQNTAHDIALAIREAQVYGIAVRNYNNQGFNYGYGMHFTLPTEGSPTTYELFADLSKNGRWESGEELESTTIGGGYRIVQLCARTGAASVDCTLNELSVIFRRPEPDACISPGDSAMYSTDKCSSAAPNQAKVVLESRGGETSTIIVESSGQISVQ